MCILLLCASCYCVYVCVCDSLCLYFLVSACVCVCVLSTGVYEIVCMGYRGF